MRLSDVAAYFELTYLLALGDRRLMFEKVNRQKCDIKKCMIFCLTLPLTPSLQGREGKIRD